MGNPSPYKPFKLEYSERGKDVEYHYNNKRNDLLELIGKKGNNALRTEVLIHWDEWFKAFIIRTRSENPLGEELIEALEAKRNEWNAQLTATEPPQPKMTGSFWERPGEERANGANDGDSRKPLPWYLRE